MHVPAAMTLLVALLYATPALAQTPAPTSTSTSSPAPAPAATSGDPLAAAGAAYDRGDYARAVTLWQSALPDLEKAAGCIAEICAVDGEMVAQHALLLRIQPDPP